MNTVKETLEHYLGQHDDVVLYIDDLDQQTACNAFSNTSFSPENRGIQYRAYYALELIKAKSTVYKNIENAKRRGADVAVNANDIVDEWFEGFRERLKAAYTDYFHSHARCMSSMITGPARFPVESNRKKIGYADAKMAFIAELLKSGPKRVLKALLPYGDGTTIKSEDPNAVHKIEAKISNLEASKDRMKAINVVVRRYYKKGDPNVSDEQKQKCIVDLEAMELSICDIEKVLTPMYGRVKPFAGYNFSNISAEIRRLKGRIKEVEMLQDVTANDEGETFENGIRYYISDDQKICIEFGYKPDEDVRTALKRRAFKFSRYRDGAWVRKLTANSKAVFEREIKPLLQSLDSAEAA